jgi:hypothetical protein
MRQIMTSNQGRMMLLAEHIVPALNFPDGAELVFGFAVTALVSDFAREFVAQG